MPVTAALVLDSRSGVGDGSQLIAPTRTSRRRRTKAPTEWQRLRTHSPSSGASRRPTAISYGSLFALHDFTGLQRSEKTGARGAAGGCRRRTRNCRSSRTRRCRWRRWCGNRAQRRGCLGRSGSRTASCGASTEAAVSCASRAGRALSRGWCLALAGLRCSYINCRENVRLTSAGGETNERLLFHGTGAIKPQARA